MNEDTILVSICAVNSETGVRQPLRTIKQVINKYNPEIILHSDITQALGKVQINFNDFDWLVHIFYFFLVQSLETVLFQEFFHFFQIIHFIGI